jgi:hypothetical protein
LPEKHDTSELIKRRMLGLPLEDPEPEPLIKRGPGKWTGMLFFLNRFVIELIFGRFVRFDEI